MNSHQESQSPATRSDSVAATEVLELLAQLASRGIRLSVEGDDLNCYAQKGALTKEVRNSIADKKAAIIQILKKYSSNVPVSAPSILRSKTGPIDKPGSQVLDLEAEAVLDPAIQPLCHTDSINPVAAKAALLTGASGFLGAYLLHDLINETCASIYCLVRCRSENDGRDRIKRNLQKYGLWQDEFASRLVPVPGDLAQPLLGVGSEAFDNLCRNIDVVYHNGAMVNFIYPYAHLKDSNVRGTAEVIRLACRERVKSLHFISTVGVFSSTTNENNTVYESELPALWQELPDGYRQSKWVAEKIVNIAAGRGLPVSLYRPGFVAGDSRTGIWNTDDFVPRILKGCIQLGIAPDSDAMIEMVPVDYVGRAIGHLSRQGKLRSNVFNIVNPKYVPAREVGQILNSLGYNIRVLPYSDWRKILLQKTKTSSENALYPLLSMFTEIPPFDRAPGFDCSNTVEGLKGTQIACPEINRDLVSTYLKYFTQSGFLDAKTSRLE